MPRHKRMRRNGAVHSRELFESRLRVEKLEERIVLSHTMGHDPPGQGGGGGGGGNSDDPSYTIMALGSRGGGRSQANDINDANQVVGWTTLPGDEIATPFLINPVVDSATQELAWFQDADADGINDLMIPLGTFGGIDSYATGINEDGQIVGTSQDADFVDHAFLINPLDADEDGTPDTWYQDADEDDRNDLMIDLGLGYAGAINNSGQIAGYTGSLSGQSTTAFVIDPKDVDSDGVLDWNFPPGSETNPLMIDLQVGNDYTAAYDINDAGMTVGGSNALGGFVITPETTDPDGDSRWVHHTDADGLNDLAVVLPDAVGGADSAGLAMSNTSLIAGHAQPDGDGSNQAARWQIDPSGSPAVTVLGLLKNNDNFSVARDVNDAGIVVGHSQGLTGRNNLTWKHPREPFLTVNGEMTALESLVTDMGGLDDLDEAWAVNNGGYIVGVEGNDATFGDQMGFIAIPSQTTANLASAITTSGTESHSAAALPDYDQAGASTERTEKEQAPPPLWAIDLIYASLGED